MPKINNNYTLNSSGVGQPGAAKVSQQYRERAGLEPLPEEEEGGGL